MVFIILISWESEKNINKEMKPDKIESPGLKCIGPEKDVSHGIIIDKFMHLRDKKLVAQTTVGIIKKS